ncbi:MAG TPA: hypothetical protein VFN87_18680 [Solirubrobacteraceae bacterium]|nr:hypothetical protein [Solirubrobacteraceae bacterium]
MTTDVRPAEALLRRLASADESCLGSVLSAPAARTSRAAPGAGVSPASGALAPDVRALVRLAALLAVDGPTPSVCWAAELASVAGVTDDRLVAVLLAVMSCARAAQVELTASRLATVFADR